MKAPFSVLILLLAATGLYAQGTTFTYQGRLNAGGTPANGSYDLVFTVYASASGLNDAFVNQTNSATSVSNGLFTVNLNLGDPNIFTGEDRWLEIAVRTNGTAVYEKLNPRQKLTPTPYAITAANVVSGGLRAGIYGNAVTFSNVANSFSGNGSGLANVNASTLGGQSAANFWNTSGNIGTTPGSQFIGTLDDQPLTVRVNNAIALQFVPGATLPNLVGGMGSFRPSVLAPCVSGAVIVGGNAPSGAVFGGGGGDFHAVYDNDGTVGGGFGNKVGSNDGDITDAAFATVAGGVFNSAANYAATVCGGDGNFAGGQRSFIGGGYGNVVQADFSVAGGGLQNSISPTSDFTVIAGGAQNNIGPLCSYGTISGGSGNAIQSDNIVAIPGSTVGGGVSNSISGSDATIGGGLQNSIEIGAYRGTIGGGEHNAIQSQAGDATIGGGFYNTIETTAGLSTIGGGGNNHILAFGQFGTIPGGYLNTATNFAFAAGFRAKANHSGSFVWADSSNSDFISTAVNKVRFRCVGGFDIVTAVAPSGGSIAGVSVGPGGTSWGTISDRRAKKNFQPVETVSVLEKLATVPVMRWNYLWEEDGAVPHLGPTAQDFKAAFFPGREDKTISTLEFDGVALAAIQGLNQKLADELKRRDAENTALKQELGELRNLVNRLADKVNGGAE